MVVGLFSVKRNDSMIGPCVFRCEKESGFGRWFGEKI